MDGDRSIFLRTGTAKCSRASHEHYLRFLVSLLHNVNNIIQQRLFQTWTAESRIVMYGFL